MRKTKTILCSVIALALASTAAAQPVFSGYIEFPRETKTVSGGVGKGEIADLNRRVNRAIKYKLSASWQSPEETLALGSGDCKDYATLKRRLLLERGVPAEDLKIIVGRLAGLGHAWLAVYLGDGWLVLDNNFDQLIRPDDYINFEPAFAFDAVGKTKFGRAISLERERTK